MAKLNEALSRRKMGAYRRKFRSLNNGNGIFGLCGELTEEQARAIILEKPPEETARIKAKVTRLAELGLSWKDL